MIKMLFATAAALTFVSAASAADMPIKAPPIAAPVVFSWTGCYIGGNVGWARSEHDLSTSVPADSNMNDTARAAIINTGAVNLDSDGFTGGFQAGCNWQPVGSAFVAGIEGDINFADVDASRDTGNFVEPVSGRTVRSVDDIGMDWFSTIRARVGFAIDRVLIYGTGGVAFADIDITKRFAWDFADGCPVVGGLDQCHVGGLSDTRAGWTVGAGLEWAYNLNWSAKVEYLFADFGDDSYRTINANIPDQPADHAVDSTLQVVRFGINYRFGGGAPVVANY